jgi:TPR repeat protein
MSEMKRLTARGAGARFVLGGFLCLVCLMMSGGLAWGAKAKPKAEEPVPQHPRELMERVYNDAERGDPKAMLAMGHIFMDGVIVLPNFAIAREWYEKAAESGLAEGIFYVGMCWEIGAGAVPDLVKAAEFYKRAAEMNMPDAMYRMAIAFNGGFGVERDETAAMDYLKRAAEAGHPDAAAAWGLLHLNGDPDKSAKGLDMLKVAAEGGNVEAMKNIAVVYKNGIGIEASPYDALKWYLIAEKCGYPKEGIESMKGELSKQLKKNQLKKAESEANAWIKAATDKAQTNEAE